MLFQELCENWVEYWDVSPKSLSWRMEIPHYFACPSFSAIKTSAMPFGARWWWVRVLYTCKDRFWFLSSTLLLKRHYLDLRSHQEYAFLEFSILNPAAYFQIIAFSWGFFCSQREGGRIPSSTKLLESKTKDLVLPSSHPFSSRQVG